MMNNPSPGGPTILIIYEDDAVAINLRIRLIRAGFSAQRAASGEEALVKLNSAHVDLILLSLLLPDTDGLILFPKLKEHTDAPIIIMSQRPRDVDRVLALELGAHDFLTWPIDFNGLVARLQTLEAQPSRPRTPYD
jgi:two-component system KDP operon response regulator KdpE